MTSKNITFVCRSCERQFQGWKGQDDNLRCPGLINHVKSKGNIGCLMVYRSANPSADSKFIVSASLVHCDRDLGNIKRKAMPTASQHTTDKKRKGSSGQQIVIFKDGANDMSDISTGDEEDQEDSSTPHHPSTQLLEQCLLNPTACQRIRSLLKDQPKNSLHHIPRSIPVSTNKHFRPKNLWQHSLCRHY